MIISRIGHNQSWWFESNVYEWQNAVSDNFGCAKFLKMLNICKLVIKVVKMVNFDQKLIFKFLICFFVMHQHLVLKQTTWNVKFLTHFRFLVEFRNRRTFDYWNQGSAGRDEGLELSSCKWIDYEMMSFLCRIWFYFNRLEKIQGNGVRGRFDFDASSAFLGNKQSKFRSQQNLFQGNLCLMSILKVMGVLAGNRDRSENL